MSKPFSLSRQERLKSRKQIEALFLHGEALFIFPFRIKFSLHQQSDKPGMLFAVSVPKRIFKKAVCRNRLKRLTREAYRVAKTRLNHLLHNQEASMNMMFTYTHKELLSYAEIAKAMQQALLTLEGVLEKRLQKPDQ